MGLLDVLNGMQNGPHGAPQPKSGGSGGGMSPMTMAILGLLAYKAVKSLSGGQAAPAGAGRPAAPAPGGTASASVPGGGGLGDLLGGLFGGAPGGAKPGASPGGSLPGGLGGLLAGAGAGGVLSGGLASIIKDLEKGGQGRAAQSWVGTGPNQEIDPDNLESALGSDTLNTLTKQTGMSRDDLLEGLSQYLPGVIDHLTPNGRLPTEHEASRMV